MEAKNAKKEKEYAGPKQNCFSNARLNKTSVSPKKSKQDYMREKNEKKKDTRPNSC